MEIISYIFQEVYDIDIISVRIFITVTYIYKGAVEGASFFLYFFI